MNNRCENCGYVNSKTANTCIKCRAKLCYIPLTVDKLQKTDMLSDVKETKIGLPPQAPYLDIPREIPKNQEDNIVTAKQTARKVSNMTSEGKDDNKTANPKKTLGIKDFKGFGVANKPAFRLFPTDEKQSYSLEFEGEEIILNRENIDSDDMTISGESHAKLEFRNGQWFISNTSSNRATFLQVTKDILLKDEDVIILGQGKIFKFKKI